MELEYDFRLVVLDFYAMFMHSYFIPLQLESVIIYWSCLFKTKGIFEDNILQLKRNKQSLAFPES